MKSQIENILTIRIGSLTNLFSCSNKIFWFNCNIVCFKNRTNCMILYMFIVMYLKTIQETIT